MTQRRATVGRTQARPARLASARPRVRPAKQRRRRKGAFIAIALVLVGALGLPSLFRHAVNEIALPLRHEDIIRQQAHRKGLDPALVAAVIYAETKFVPRTSAAGARGLMQILPSTATFLARRSGGTAFVAGDLATPQVNIAYGSYYLRYLLGRYGGREVPAVAAYNGGETNVDRWIARAGGGASSLTVAAIPFSETRAYVQKVLTAQRDYRRSYARELGLKR